MKNKISPLTQNTHALKMSTLNEFINLEKIYKLKNGLNLKFHLAIHCLGCSIFNLYIFCGKKCGESKLFSEGVLECIIIIVSLRFFLLNVAQRPGSKFDDSIKFTFDEFANLSQVNTSLTHVSS